MYARRRGGLGDSTPGSSPSCMQVSDLVSACGGTGTQNCTGVGNQQCVAVQTDIVSWAEDLVDSYFPCMPPGTPYTCPSINAAAATQAEEANQGYAPVEIPTNSPTGQEQGFLTTQFYQNLFGGESEPAAANNAYYTPPPTASAPAGSSSSGASSSGSSVGSQSSGSPPVTAPTTSTGGGGSTAAVSGNWFTGSMIDNIPNWLLLVGAGLGALLVFGGSHGK